MADRICIIRALGRHRAYRTLLTSSVIALNALLGSEAWSNTYAKLSGIDGESQRLGYRDWIDINAFHSKIYAVSASAILESITAPLDGSELFYLGKRMDAASPYLAKGALAGQWFESLQVDHFAGSERKASIRMRGVSIKHYELNTLGESEMLHELVGFDYDLIEWHYTRDDLETNTSHHVGTTWNFQLGTGGSIGDDSNQPPKLKPMDPLGMVPGETLEFIVELDGDPVSEPGQVLSINPIGIGLIEVVDISKQGSPWTVTIRATELFNGSDILNITFSDGKLGNVSQLPVVVAGEQTAFEAYVEGYLSEWIARDPSAGLPLGDPDDDGLNTAMEFLMGTHPGQFTATSDVFSFNPAQGEGGMEIVMRYYIRSDVNDLSHWFEATNSLEADWKMVGANAYPSIDTIRLKSDPNEPYDQMESRVEFGNVDPGSFFIRLHVESTFE